MEQVNIDQLRDYPFVEKSSSSIPAQSWERIDAMMKDVFSGLIALARGGSVRVANRADFELCGPLDYRLTVSSTHFLLEQKRGGEVCKTDYHFAQRRLRTGPNETPIRDFVPLSTFLEGIFQDLENKKAVAVRLDSR